MGVDLKIENVRDAVLDYSRLLSPWQSPIRQFFSSSDTHVRSNKQAF
jgi:hypothetical protein